MSRTRLAAILTVAGAVLGLVFAAYSTYDYAQHLDRQVHGVHCSFIPGASATSQDNACKTALFSPFSAVLRQSFWGGIPIALFAVGTFAFFVGFGLYMLLAGERTPRRALHFLGIVGFGPFVASAVMATISALELHTFCKLCVGIYFSSTLVAASAVMGWLVLRGEKDVNARPPGKLPALLGWTLGLGLAALLPAVAYAGSLPDYRPYLTSCGKLAVTKESHDALLKIPTTNPKRAVTLFEDPLCPTCKAFHERLVYDGVFDRLDVTLVLFPLDTECNWMLDRSLHPGACVLSKALLCGKDRTRAMLEWSFANQDDLRDLGKSSPKALEDRIVTQWGADMRSCIDSPETKVRLNRNLHYASDNHVPVSTPQMYLGDRRVCDEDTDLGLKYTLSQLAPEVLP